jgi:ankyrin repeat protein
MARVLLTAGANPDQKDLRSWTPLHIAGGRGNLQMISVLLEHGADPTIVNRRGDTPANLAEVLGQHEAAARLREATQDLHE